jgi:dihydroorotase
MMKFLLKSVKIIDPKGPHHGETADILVEDGIIRAIEKSIKNADATLIQADQLHLSSGWFDPSVSFGEPGLEERETLAHGAHIAALSGYTAVGVNPNTQPVLQNKSDMAFVKAKSNIVDLHPIGALTTDSRGQDLAELYDMHQAGAIAFNDYQKPIANPNLLKLALEYTQSFNGLILSFPMEIDLAQKGMINEGLVSVTLGLKGIPNLAETLQISRDLNVLSYSGGRLHIPTISTKESVDLIKRAKSEGLAVTCSVSINHLCLTDQALNEFDTNFKMLPPLRTEQDRLALIQGLKDGVIDGVTSDHNPIDIEHKKVEFDHAAFGSIGLESCFGALLGVVDLDTTIEALTGLKAVFGLETNNIAINQPANFTLFNPSKQSTFSRDLIHSTSGNAALVGQKMTGSVLGIMNHGQWVANEA